MNLSNHYYPVIASYSSQSRDNISYMGSTFGMGWSAPTSTVLTTFHPKLSIYQRVSFLPNLLTCCSGPYGEPIYLLTPPHCFTQLNCASAGGCSQTHRCPQESEFLVLFLHRTYSGWNQLVLSIYCLTGLYLLWGESFMRMRTVPVRLSISLYCSWWW